MKLRKDIVAAMFILVSSIQTAGAQIVLSDLNFWKFEHTENEELRGGPAVQLNTRPLVEKIAEKDNEPLFHLRKIGFEYTSSSNIPSNQQREGIWITKGDNYHFYSEMGLVDEDYTIWIEPKMIASENLSLDEHPEGAFHPRSGDHILRYPEESEAYAKGFLHSGYGLFPFANWYLFLGKDNQKFGTGKHDSLHFSNSAEPFPMVRLGMISPYSGSWGNLSFLAYYGQMEADREVPNAKFSGMRFDWNSDQYFEVGVSRSWFAGGKEQNNSFSHTYWDLTNELFKPKSGIESRSDFRNQQIVLDFRIKIPVLKTVLYGEWGREDHQFALKDSIIYWDSTHGYILGLKNIDLFFPGFFWLFEKANNVQPSRYGASAPWYNHSEYKSGWTYKKQTLGHHMGADSQDLFFALGFEGPQFSIMFYQDAEEHGIRTIELNRRELKMETGFKGFWNFMPDFYWDFEFQMQKYKNFGEVTDNTIESTMVIMGIRYQI